MPDWNYLFPTASELVQYYQNFAKYYKITDCTTFDQNVTQATWSEERSLWVVDVEDALSGACKRWTCRILIQAAGTYNRTSTPQIPGMDQFTGDMWHASEWPAKYDFTGKSVAYVGTGPTSVQVLPYIQAQAKSVSVFCRSMTYCHPFNNFKYPAWIKWAFRWIPGFLALYAFLVGNLFGLWAYFAFRPESWMAKNTERYCRRTLEKQVPDDILRQKLTPVGRFGSKRPLVSLSGFFETLQKDNVEVIGNPIVGVDEYGVITKRPHTDDVVLQIDDSAASSRRSSESQPKTQSLHIQADVLIWGTGFKMQGWGGAVPTIGRDGQVLSDHWKNSPNALYGSYTHCYQLDREAANQNLNTRNDDIKISQSHLHERPQHYYALVKFDPRTGDASGIQSQDHSTHLSTICHASTLYHRTPPRSRRSLDNIHAARTQQTCY